MRKGQKMSDEQRARVAAAMRGNKNSLGRVLSEETRRKISASMEGIEFSSNHKENLAAARKGRKLSESHREKIGLSGKGKNCHFYIHGNGSKGYDFKFNNELKKQIRERDGNKCTNCPKTNAEHLAETGQQLPVHHINEDKEDSRPENLTTLCIACHLEVHRNVSK